MVNQGNIAQIFTVNIECEVARHTISLNYFQYTKGKSLTWQHTAQISLKMA